MSKAIASMLVSTRYHHFMRQTKMVTNRRDADASARCISSAVFAACRQRGTGIADYVSPATMTYQRSADEREQHREASNMIRYGFTIRTRTGQRVDNVSIIAGSQLDAERRLRQMYVQCEILECRERSIPRRYEAANMHLIDLMAISPPTIQHHG